MLDVQGRLLVTYVPPRYVGGSRQNSLGGEAIYIELILGVLLGGFEEYEIGLSHPPAESLQI